MKNMASERGDGTVLKFKSVIKKQGTNVLDLKVPKELEMRVPSGIAYLDDLLGAGEKEQGITPSTSILFTGGAGAGKTTQALSLADAWTAQGNIAIVNGQEESPLQVRKTTKRLVMKNGFIIGEDRKIPDVLNHADNMRKLHPGKSLLLIVDSLQTHDDGFYKDGGTNSMTPVRVTNLVTDYCKEHFAIGMLIGQVNKDGKFAGKMAIKHAIDVHLHLAIDQKPSSETFGKRIMKVEKNRFGYSNVGYFLGMNEKGLYADGAWLPITEE
jgi:predicted ATP-dependent serine protease